MPSHCLPLAKASSRSLTSVSLRAASGRSRSSTSARLDRVMEKLPPGSRAISSMFTRFWMSMHRKSLSLISETTPTAPMGRKLSAVSWARGCSCFCMSSVTRSPGTGSLSQSAL